MSSLRKTRQVARGCEGHGIPKPTKVNIQEKLLKVPLQRPHPYESHTTRFALFPTPDCTDDAARPSLNPRIPIQPPHITVLSKTKGAPFRHEVHSVTREEPLTWPGQHGFYHHPKLPESTSQVFYPTPPKGIYPNPSLRPWSTTLSERMARMLHNVKRSRWLTSHQLDFTGCGPMNPLNLDDFHEKMVAVAGGANPHAVQLREQFHSTFTPAKPMDGHRQRIRDGYWFLQYPYPPSFQLNGHTDQASAFSKAVVSAGRTTDQGGQDESHKRTPVTPGGDAAPLSRSRSILLELQDSFSRTGAHQHLQQTLQYSPADLRDGMCTGKRCRFYGFHSYYFRN